MALNPRQRAFIREYPVDFNGTQAAIRAGYSEIGAAEQAFRLLTNAEIMEAVEDKIQERLELADLNIDWVLRQYKMIASADPSELMWTVITCCPYCYPGENFDPNLPPTGSCVMCRGDGEHHVRVAETRKLKGSARRLYAGVKKTKDGIEVKMRDQDGALKFLAQYFGMVVERRELSGSLDVTAPGVTPQDLTLEQLDALIAQAQARLEAENKTIEGERAG